MKFRLLFTLILIVSFQAFAQDETSILEVKEDPQKLYNGMTQEQLQQRLDKYMQGILKEAGYTHPTSTNATDFDLQRRRDDLADCITEVLNLGQGKLKDRAPKAISQCNEKVNLLTRSQLDAFIDNGMNAPYNFENDLEREIEENRVAYKKSSKDSRVTKKENFVRFDRMAKEKREFSIPGFENIGFTIDDISKVLVEFNKNATLPDVIRDISVTKDNEDLAFELNRLQYFRQFLSENIDPCHYIDTIESFDSDDPLMKSLLTDPKGELVKDDSVSDISSMLLNISVDKLKKVDGFKFKLKDGSEIFVFRKKVGTSDNEKWVVAQVDPKTKKVSYQGFDLVVQEPVRYFSTNNRDYIKIVNLDNINVRLDKGRRSRTYFDANLGLFIEVNDENVPVLGRMNIPTGDVDLMYAVLDHRGPKVSSSTTFSAAADEVEMRTSFRPSKSANWSVNGGLEYRTFDSKWRASANLRLHRLSVGYSSDLKGKESMRIGYFVRGAFVGYTTDFKMQTDLSAGYNFKNHAGGIYASTDFKKKHNITLFIALDRKRKRPRRSPSNGL